MEKELQATAGLYCVGDQEFLLQMLFWMLLLSNAHAYDILT